MSSAKIKERTTFLMDFLDLPRSSRLVRQMSGGQQRRISLAAAMLHQPQLLILDEPTVGVDPLLRQCIWNHLLEISRGKQVCTIVITTHYIEEARKADMVGMMRYGRLLAEDTPQQLLSLYAKPSLESVFLHLCLSDDNDSARDDKENEEVIPLIKVATAKKTVEPELDPIESPDDFAFRKKTDNTWLSFHRLSALLMKNFIRMWRNLGFLTFQFIIPAVQVALFCLAIGREPTNLSLAVVNADVNVTDKCHYYSNGCILGNKDDFMGTYDFHEGHKTNLSCRYLSYIDTNFIRPVFFDNLTLAEEAVRNGKHWGMLEFKANYTDSLYDRMFGLAELRTPTNETLEASDIHVSLDMTNQQV